MEQLVDLRHVLLSDHVGSGTALPSRISDHTSKPPQPTTGWRQKTAQSEAAVSSCRLNVVKTRPQYKPRARSCPPCVTVTPLRLLHRRAETLDCTPMLIDYHMHTE